MLIPNLIYCDGKNKNYAQIAVESGFLYGARLPSNQLLDQQLVFSDVDWKMPDESGYLSAIMQLRPTYATVIDIEDSITYNQALLWANKISAVVDKIIIIPKIDIIDRLPKEMNGKEIILGYSVPSSYGKTDLPFSRFLDYRIHLLGGSPHTQMKLHLQYPDSIFSADGNYITKMATSHRRYWTPGNNVDDPNRFWRRDSISLLSELIRLSSINVLASWRTLHNQDVSWLADRRTKSHRLTYA